MDAIELVRILTYTATLESIYLKLLPYFSGTERNHSN